MNWPGRKTSPADCNGHWVRLGNVRLVDGRPSTEVFWRERAFMHVLVVAILLFIVIGPSWAEEAIVTDGDTLILNGIPYQLDGIDAPETDQVCLNEKRNIWACGLEARDQLRNFVGKRDVRCDTTGYDTVYRNRRIAVCWVGGETN